MMLLPMMMGTSLRGPVDPADFKAYIFPILFFKWISDTWDWEHARAVAEFEDDLNEEIEADYHRFVVPPDAHWSELRKRWRRDASPTATSGSTSTL